MKTKGKTKLEDLEVKKIDSFTAFKLFILIVYVWFAVGIAVISVFAIRELFSWFKVPNEHISQSIQKGPRKNYEM